MNRTLKLEATFKATKHYLEQEFLVCMGIPFQILPLFIKESVKRGELLIQISGNWFS